MRSCLPFSDEGVTRFCIVAYKKSWSSAAYGLIMPLLTVGLRNIPVGRNSRANERACDTEALMKVRSGVPQAIWQTRVGREPAGCPPQTKAFDARRPDVCDLTSMHPLKCARCAAGNGADMVHPLTEEDLQSDAHATSLRFRLCCERFSRQRSMFATEPCENPGQ